MYNETIVSITEYTDDNPLDNMIWRTCSTCWGQRQIFESARNGEGLIPTTCPECNGIGDTLDITKKAIAA